MNIKNTLSKVNPVSLNYTEKPSGELYGYAYVFALITVVLQFIPWIGPLTFWLSGGVAILLASIAWFIDLFSFKMKSILYSLLHSFIISLLIVLASLITAYMMPALMK